MNTDMVWSAYQALHLYFLPIGSYDPGLPAKKPGGTAPKKPAVPIALSEVPGETNIRAVEQLASEVAAAWPVQPALISKEYYTYLYLFAQVLRCRLKNNPKFINGQWQRLTWYPIVPLAGKANGQTQKAWNAFYWRYIGGVRPTPDERSLSIMFPMPKPYVETTLPTLERQIQYFNQLRNQNELPQDIFAQYSPLGCARTAHDKQKWHPLIVLSQPSSWMDKGLAWNDYYHPAFMNMLEDRSIAKLWNTVKTQMPVEEIDAHWGRVIGQIDRFFDKKRKNKSLERKWRLFRKDLNG